MGVRDAHEVRGHGGRAPPKIQTFCYTEGGDSGQPETLERRAPPAVITEDASPLRPESLYLGPPLAAKRRTRCFVKLPPWEVYGSIGNKIKIQPTNKENEYFS